MELTACTYGTLKCCFDSCGKGRQSNCQGNKASPLRGNTQDKKVNKGVALMCYELGNIPEICKATVFHLNVSSCDDSSSRWSTGRKSFLVSRPSRCLADACDPRTEFSSAQETGWRVPCPLNHITNVFIANRRVMHHESSSIACQSPNPVGSKNLLKTNRTQLHPNTQLNEISALAHQDEDDCFHPLSSSVPSSPSCNHDDFERNLQSYTLPRQQQPRCNKYESRGSIEHARMHLC